MEGGGEGGKKGKGRGRRKEGRPEAVQGGHDPSHPAKACFFYTVMMYKKPPEEQGTRHTTLGCLLIPPRGSKYTPLRALFVTVFEEERRRKQGTPRMLQVRKRREGKSAASERLANPTS